MGRHPSTGTKSRSSQMLRTIAQILGPNSTFSSVERHPQMCDMHCSQPVRLALPASVTEGGGTKRRGEEKTESQKNDLTKTSSIPGRETPNWRG